MIRLALIGCGAWGWRFVPAALESGACRVTHVAGARLSNSSFDAHLLGLHHVPSHHWRALLDAPVDAFIVATPPDTHEEICTALLAAGRPVMVEKPVALNVHAANAIAEAARKSGATLLVNHQHLFAPAYEALRDLVHTGPLWEVRSEAGGDGPHRTYSALWDYGPHDVAMAVGLARGAVSVLDAKRYERTFALKLSVDDARACVAVSSGMRQRRRSFWATGPCVVARYDALAEHQLTSHGSPVAVDPERPLQRAVRIFARAVATGETDWRFRPDFSIGVTRLLATAEAMIQQQEA